MSRLVTIAIALGLAAGPAHAEIRQNSDTVKTSDLRPLSNGHESKFRELIGLCPDFWLYDNAGEFHVLEGKCYAASSVPSYSLLEK